MLNLADELLEQLHVTRHDLFVLGGDCNFALNGQTSQKLFNFFFTHDVRMLLFVQEKETLDPVDITPFDAIAVVLEPEFVSHLTQQSRFICYICGSNTACHNQT